MWDKINKISVQIIVAVISIVCLNAMGFLLFFREIPAGNRDIATYFIGQLQGAIIAAIFGWLYTYMKNANKPPTS